MSEKRCGYAVVDLDGTQEPCDRPATGWRWYQDCEHEDMLDVACDWHANEGGKRLAAVQALAERWASESNERGPDDQISSAGAAAMILHALGDPA